MKQEIYMQQGDVILYKINKIPDNAREVTLTSNSFVIEKGEGVHTHRLLHPQLRQVCIIKEDKENIYFQTNADLELVHEEHGTSIIPEGEILFKVKEREFDYETMESRATID